MGFVVNYPPPTQVTVDETTNAVVIAGGRTGPQGPQGNPTTVNGKTGASITLDAADVGAVASTDIATIWYGTAAQYAAIDPKDSATLYVVSA